MNILFLTMSGNIKSLDAPGIYTDLLRQFTTKGHSVYAVSPGDKASLLCGENWKILKVKTDRGSGGNLIKKGIGQMLIRSQFEKAIAAHFTDLRPGLILYTTPPITLAGLIAKLKKKHHAATYLLLKDIFPQNAADLNMMSPRGIKSPIFWFFRRMEKKLYAVSDRIGCMSQANVEYILKHNPKIDPAIVEVCPNSVEPRDMHVDEATRIAMREKYELPLDKKIFVYGGNLGKPQGIGFLMECLKAQRDNPEAFFLVVGGGTEFSKLEDFVKAGTCPNMRLMSRLPKEDYDQMVAACDAGMIFLDHRFTIPNFPSRLLSYMQAKLPVLACTDPNTDVGKAITEGGFGWWCESNDADAFGKQIEAALAADLPAMGEAGYAYLTKHYGVADACRTILAATQREDCVCETVEA